jgi:nitrogen fixation/metabolism regulation signal transduction histidine kinase
MGFSQFGLAIGLRMFIILITLSVSGFLLVTPGYPVSMLLVLICAVVLSLELYTFVAKTNREIARFLDAARYADFGQRFEFVGLGAGFKELGDTFTFILDRFREDRSQNETEVRQLKAMLEHVPVPLLSVGRDKQLTLWNNAARRLFGRFNLTQVEDLNRFGKDISERILFAEPGSRMLLTLNFDGHDQTFSIGTSEIAMATKTLQLLSLQNIQSELDVTQLQAWQDLVRVLTHEIMNSITPVSSLARTAVDLVDDVSHKVAADEELVAELADVKDAVNTVARRADGLMNFVSSYRRLTRLPEPNKSRFAVDDLLAGVRRIVLAQGSDQDIAILISVEPQGLELYADRQMIEQVLINLAQNALYAVEHVVQPKVELRGTLSQSGQVTIEVLDNGQGIAADVAVKIFVPFFTTRKNGSGVGLALSRQIMIANEGTISFNNRESGGARFSLAF